MGKSISSSGLKSPPNDKPLLIGVELKDDMFERSIVEGRGEESNEDIGGDDLSS